MFFNNSISLSRSRRPVRALVPTLEPCEPLRLMSAAAAPDLQGATDAVDTSSSTGASQVATDDCSTNDTSTPGDPTNISSDDGDTTPADATPSADSDGSSDDPSSTDQGGDPSSDSASDDDGTDPAAESDFPLIGKVSWS
jgi:hypothetical protein